MPALRFLSLWCLCFLANGFGSFQLKAQTYGNEWFTPNVATVKFKIWKDGIYRLTYFDIETPFQYEGVSVQTIFNNQFRLYAMGKQIPIYIKDNGDGRFTPGDYIEFVGHKADGTFDTELYESSKDQRHTYESIISDTQVYYLTYSSAGTPLRYANYVNTNYGSYTPRDYYIANAVHYESFSYDAGQGVLISDKTAYPSEYNEGEGFIGQSFGINAFSNSKKTVSFNTQGFYSAGPTPVLGYCVKGISNYYYSLDHKLNVYVGPNLSSMRRIWDTTFSATRVIKNQQVITNADVGSANTFITFEPELPSGIPSSFYAYSHSTLDYPRIYDLNGTNNIQYRERSATNEFLVEWSNYGNGSNNAPILYDEENLVRVIPQYDANGNKIRYILPSAVNGAKITLGDTNFIELVTGPKNGITGFKFKNYSTHLNAVQYLFITSERLDGPEVDNYISLWNSKYFTKKVLVEELYDAFAYGFKHPLAIRHYTQYLYENSPTMKPLYLLLMGRGFETGYNRGSGYNSLKPFQSRNYIPVMGNPASDLMFTSGFGGTFLEPAIPTGRIPADSKADIAKYAEKVKDYVSNNYQPWQKNVMHLGGGASADQTFVIRQRMEILEPYPQSNPFAGQVKAYYKTSSGVVDPNIRPQIISNINNGTYLMTFLGHGSTNVTDIDVGDTAEYFNTGKYPIAYFNGCSVGNPCVPVSLGALGLSEKMFRAYKRGAIAFLGQTNISELFTVARQMETFYQSMFDSIPNKGLGDVVKSSVKKFQTNTLGGALIRIHARQLFLQGDPALPIYMPEKPDYAVTKEGLFLDPENTIALSDSFKLGIQISNYGKGVNDSIKINLERIYPDGVTKQFYEIKHLVKSLKDTAYIVIRSKDRLTKGDNVFNVVLNKDRDPEEFDYSNNEVSWTRFIPGNGVNLVYPPRFGIVGDDTIDLIVQSSDLFKDQEDYYLEIDTTPRFNPLQSGMFQSLERPVNNPITAGILAKWRVALNPPKDTQMYFWRARLSLDAINGGQWVSGSFTYIKDHKEGWMQNLGWQFREEVAKNKNFQVLIDTIPAMHFAKVAKKIYLDAEFNNPGNKGVKESGFGSQDLNCCVCINAGFVAMLWDPNKLERVPMDSSVMYPNCWAGQLWEYFGNNTNYQVYYDFEMSTSSGQDLFIKFVDNVPDSLYVTIFTRRSTGVTTWKPAVFDALNELGLSIFDSVNNRRFDAVYVALGKKGARKGTMPEQIGFGNYVQLETEMYGDANLGNVSSELIGPSNQFNSFHFRSRLDNGNPQGEADKLTYDILGVKPDGKIDIVKANLSQSPVNLSDIDTRVYRFLQLKANLEDKGQNTAPEVLNWRVVYDSVPEGSLFPLASAGYKMSDDTLYEGENFEIKLPFKNISSTPFRDSILLEYSLYQKLSRVVLTSGKLKYKALPPDSIFTFNYNYKSDGLNGPYALQVTVNPQYTQPEQTLANNGTTINFFVQKDIINPILDVTFDGRHILDGEIVSANPIIKISSKDENKYLLQNDTGDMVLMIRYPGQSTFKRVYWNTGEALFFPATGNDNKASAEYRPLDLPSGVYILKVQSNDRSGNNAGAYEYQISFNVIREQTVTQFYPYPNPFTTQMKFVFTLTGSDIPDEIKVKIMTSDGRVVKEVTKDELGPLRIGNNITDWSWDGTDQFGDRLANGVYFYKVEVRHAGQNVNIRQTKGDAYFKEQVGKIYLLR